MAIQNSNTLAIPAPIGYVGSRVLVLNYKMRPEQWETGTLCDLYFRPAQTITRTDASTYASKERWTYEVWVERPITEDRYGRRRGGGYRLTVSGDSVQAERVAHG